MSDELKLTTRHRQPDEIDRDYFNHGRERDDAKAKLKSLNEAYKALIREAEKAMERLQQERRDQETHDAGQKALGL